MRHGATVSTARVAHERGFVFGRSRRTMRPTTSLERPMPGDRADNEAVMGNCQKSYQ